MGHSGFGALGSLTAGERLFIVRRRKKRTQQDQADILGVSRLTYNKWERDLVSGPTENIKSLRRCERCVLNRRRAGMKQRELADELGMSRFWLNQMENGGVDCKPLVEYWEPEDKDALPF